MDIDKLAGETIGGCHLEGILGRGAMGVVYKGHHLALDIPVAVKIMHPQVGGRAGTARFLLEAQAAARLKHPNIIGVYNVGEEKGWHFIIMEAIDGGSLQQLLNERKFLSPKDAVGIALSVLAALDTAFENGIVHRDLKPDNILIDRKGTVKLGDLGLVKEIGDDEDLTRTGLGVGTPHYMAPEQAQDAKRTDHRADIYSLGCILFHMLAGNPPFEANNPIAVILKHVGEEAPELAKVNRRVDPGLSAVVWKMMRKDPSKRYQTPQEAAAALKPFFAQRDVDTQTARWFGRAIHVSAPGRPGRKMRIAVAAATMVAVVAGLLLLTRIPEVSSSRDRSKQRADERPASAPADMRDVSASDAGVAQKADTATGIILTVMDAVEQNDTAALTGLLNRGISPNYRDNAGKTPLHEAVQQSSNLFVHLLLENGADPNAVDNNGDTPLHYAIRADLSLIAEMLLETGADPNAPDSEGHTPLQMATAIGNSQLVMKLRDRGAK